MTFFTALFFALGVTLPNILLLCLGKVLRIKKTISHEFCSQASDTWCLRPCWRFCLAGRLICAA